MRGAEGAGDGVDPDAQLRVPVGRRTARQLRLSARGNQRGRRSFSRRSLNPPLCRSNNDTHVAVRYLSIRRRQWLSKLQHSEAKLTDEAPIASHASA
jgi:hypothetical protein